MQSGVVVAGGYSTRFGEADKALAPLAGTPMVQHVVERLASVVDEVVVNCRDDQRPAIREAMADCPCDVRYAIDEKPGRGPVAGIRTGLAVADGAYAFVVACDMPFLDPDLVSYLFERAQGVDAAVPRIDDSLQPLHGVYRVSETRSACAELDENGKESDPSMRRLIAALDHVVVEQEDIEAYGSTESVENVNTQADLVAARQRLGDESQ
ncbi:molybdenum cofactor guanylyltransferase [Halovenus marina]|uniref:molybdenum cofactor guanylyltransferase n=1 Tax=Halovenus marina TaxID=3396621 RepID=UPI003F54639C